MLTAIKVALTLTLKSRYLHQELLVLLLLLLTTTTTTTKEPYRYSRYLHQELLVLLLEGQREAVDDGAEDLEQLRDAWSGSGLGLG